MTRQRTQVYSSVTRIIAGAPSTGSSETPVRPSRAMRAGDKRDESGLPPSILNHTPWVLATCAQAYPWAPEVATHPMR